MSLIAVYREPFGLQPTIVRLREGVSLMQMVDEFRALPPDFAARGAICINGVEVPHFVWPLVKPKSVSSTGVPVEITFHAPPTGGVGGGKKNILATVASFALMAATGWIAAGGLATAGGMFAKGSISALFLASGVSYAGSLALAGLISMPVVDTSSTTKTASLGNASVAGNTLEPDAPLPRVVGEMRVYPPLGVEPLVYFDGSDEIAEAAFVLAGPHRISEIRIGAAMAQDASGVEFDVIEGWAGQKQQFLQRQSRTEQIGAELRAHVVGDDGLTLEYADTVASALPQPRVIETRDAPDEQWLLFSFASGLHKNASTTTVLRVPLRLRLRRVGSPSWINLPELHFQGADLREMRASIKIKWRPASQLSSLRSASSGEGWSHAHTAVPAQTTTTMGEAWDADPYFYSGTGNAWLQSDNLVSTGVQHLQLSRYDAVIELDEALFPKGRYEIEVSRGACYQKSTYAPATYAISSSVWDLFGYRGAPEKIVFARTGVYDTLYFVRAISIWNENPLPSDGVCVIAMRARNRELDAVSVVAGGYVPDWSDTGWDNWTVTDNPAPHLRAVWSGAQNLDPVPPSVIDDADLAEWRAACETAGYRCNAVLDDHSVLTAAEMIAGCGYAKPRMAERWGVARDYDRAGAAPVQLFTPRNASGFQWTRAYPKVPDGFRVTFKDASRRFETTQINVMAATGGLMEQVTYDGLTTRSEVERRALYDLAQARVRGVFYKLTAPAEAIVCRRGDLVGVAHDAIDEIAASGRVVDWSETADGTIDALRLDTYFVTLDAPEEMLSIVDLLATADLRHAGLTLGAAIRRASGQISTHAVASASEDWVTFDEPIDPAGIARDTLVTLGVRSRELLRLIVHSIEPRTDYTADITLVDEAPELWT